MSWLEFLFAPSVLLTLAAVFVPLELLLPMNRQRIFRPYWWNDLIYWVVNRHLIAVGVTVILAGAIVLGEHAVPDAVQAFVARLPIPVQLVMVVVLGDLGFYVMHRAFHHFPILWQFHAVHHSITEMDWVAGLRVHPLDQILVRGFSLVPFFLLDVSETTRGIASTLYLAQSHFVHSNTRASLGPLRYVLAGPDFHHWHHSSNPEDFDRNFAGQLPVVDWLFGTLRMPAGSRPTGYGAGDPVPTTYVAQLFYPFRRVVRLARGELPERSG